MAIIRAEAAILGGPALEIKGTIAPVTVLCLRAMEADAIEAELRARVEPAPQLFANAPVVIDVADVDGHTVALGPIVECVRRCGLIPVGVAHLPAERATQANALGLALIQVGFGKSRMARANSSAPAAPPRAAPQPVAPVRRADPPPAVDAVQTLTVRQPVRGGQVIYAQHGDLVVLAPVNAGAQVIADGNVHVYGRLRGRALAGARGHAEARVFCQSLEAELVSVCGHFLLADDIPTALRGKPAQVYVEHDEARVAPL